EVAPLLDSQKDAAAGIDEPADVNEDVEEGEADVQAPAEQAPAPAEIDVTEIPSIEAEEGQDRQEVPIEQIEQAAEQAATATLSQPAGPAQAPAARQGGVLVGPVREGPSNAEI